MDGALIEHAENDVDRKECRGDQDRLGGQRLRKDLGGALKAGVNSGRQAETGDRGVDPLLRFRPILMTTMAALFAAVPLMIGLGQGAELRRPLGVAIFGGLIVSQLLTLYTTPVIYLYLDRLRLWGGRRWRFRRRRFGAGQLAEPGE